MDSVNRTTEVIDHGQIKHLLLPAGWTETATTGSDNHEQSLREFSPQDSEDTRLCFYYRGYPYELPTGAAFKAVLETPPHSLPAKEIKSIAGMLEEVCQPDSFKPLAIHTQVTGGRTILVVEGRWLRQEWDTYSLYIAADHSGCVVQQIYFLAPTTSYPRYVKEIKECLRNIEWT